MSKLFSTVILLSIILTGCTNTIKENAYPKFVSDSNLVIFKIGNIQVDNLENADTKSEEIIISPKQAMLEWVGKKLRAKGTTGKLVIIIQDAFLRELDSIDNNEREEENIKRYNAIYNVKFHLEGVGYKAQDSIDLAIKVENYRKIVGAISLLEKQQVLLSQVKELLTTFEKEFRDKARLYFTEYVDIVD